MNFAISDQGVASASLRVDADGDLTLSINGIGVLYIRQQDGEVVPYPLTAEDVAVLERTGFKITTRPGGAKTLTRHAYWYNEKEEKIKEEQEHLSRCLLTQDV